MTTTDTPRMWVGCLGCYNAGELVGEWMDATDFDPEDPTASIPRLETRPAYGPGSEVVVCGRCGTTDANAWVFDHEGFHGLIDGECSAEQAAELARLIESADADDLPAMVAYCGAFGYKLPEVLADDDGFRESFNGTWNSREEFAQDLADDMGFVESDQWPASYIDWERAARDLFMDYTDVDAPGGQIFVFRSI